MVFCVGIAWVLRAVNANWNGDGWNVNANSVENPNRWNDGNQVFSPQLLFLSYLFGGNFVLQPFSPAAKHPSDFFNLLREFSILVGGD